MKEWMSEDKKDYGWTDGWMDGWGHGDSMQYPPAAKRASCSPSLRWQ